MKKKTTAPYYDHRWRKARVNFLASNGLCIACKRSGKVVKATIVDHIIPHKGNPTLFWDPKNWQPLCKRHHDITKQRIEKGNALIGVDAKGRPTHPNHPWNK